MAAFDFPSSPAVGDIYAPAGANVLYQWDGTVWKANPSGAIQPLSMKTTVYTPGSYTYVKPANLKFLQVELFGPGGSSSGCALTAASQASGSGGGSGGGYTRKLYKASDLAVSEALVVGDAGTAGAVNGNAGAGTDTTFKGLTAQAGFASAAGGAVGTLGAHSPRPLGGGAGIGGDLNVTGNGAKPSDLNHAGTAGRVVGGANGYCPMIGGFTQPSVSNGILTPVAGTLVGQGATGCAQGASQAAGLAGAKGGPGQAILTEYFTDGEQVGVTQEEGTFTPVIEGDSTAGVGTYTTVQGYWCKTGKLVHVEGIVIWTAHTGTGNIWIGGLPFNCKDTGSSKPLGGSIEPASLTITGTLDLLVSTGSNKIMVRQYAASTGTPTAVAMDTAATIRFAGTYMVD